MLSPRNELQSAIIARGGVKIDHEPANNRYLSAARGNGQSCSEWEK
jgi:hypothetical protein